jgi:hypothetical protein
MQDIEEEEQKPAPDSLGPKELSFDTISTRDLARHLAAGTSDTTSLVGGTVVLLDEGENCPELLYRDTRQDTLWRILASGTRQYCGVSVEAFDWDGRPPLELLLTSSYKSYGTGGGESGESVSIISLGRKPCLLLKANTLQEDEQFTGYAHMHGEKVAPGDELTGCERTVRRQGRDLIFGPIKTVGNFKKQDCTLTQLAAGRYRYQNGRVFRIRK